MGKIRESDEPDIPINADILVDDIAETVIIINRFMGVDDFDEYSFDEIDYLGRVATLASAKGRQLRHTLCPPDSGDGIDRPGSYPTGSIPERGRH